MSALRRSQIDAFWQSEPPWDASWASRKYASLVQLAKLTARDAQRASMRQIASAWPGALREAELVSPERIAQRAQRALNAKSLIERVDAPVEHPSLACPKNLGAWSKRASLADSGHGAWLLATDLTYMLRDLAQRRARQRSMGRAWDYFEVLEITHDAPSTPSIWPTGKASGMRKMRASARLAYLALAWRSGISLPTLNRIIFERRGHWDRRADDPQWAHEAGSSELWIASRTGLAISDLG